MSVCIGAFKLAKAGLLAGKPATTHHEFLDKLQSEYPDIQVKRGVRFVENEKISTAGGLTSGTDLALRVVERYFGRAVAQTTADYMECRARVGSSERSPATCRFLRPWKVKIDPGLLLTGWRAVRFSGLMPD